MADEIAQVCQLEIEGLTLVIKGSVKVAAWIAQVIKSMLASGFERVLEQRGQKHDMKDIWKLSKDGPPQVIKVDEKDLDAVLEAAKKAGLRWTRIIDFDGTDGRVPVCMPPQDAGLFSAIVNSYVQKDITESQKILNEYNEEISELKERLLHVEAGERNPIRVRIENMEQAHDELVDVLEGKKTTIESGGILSFQDYLATAAGTEFEKDPEKAMAEYAKGVELGPSIMAKDCLQPIRSKVLVPDSEMRFYVPDSGVSIVRKFETDENELVFSNYSFKSESGEVYEFSDKGTTKAAWNTQILPDILDKAGILGDTPCRLFESEEKMQVYEKYHNNVSIPSEEKAVGEQELGFSSAEAEENIQFAMIEKVKGMASAKVDENEVHIPVHAGQMFQQDGKVSIQSDDLIYQFESVLPRVAEDAGDYVLAVDKDSEVTVIDKEGEKKQISAARAQKEIFAVQQGETKPLLEAVKQRGLSARKEG